MASFVMLAAYTPKPKSESPQTPQPAAPGVVPLPLPFSPRTPVPFGLMPSTPTPPRPFDPYNAGRSAASLLAATELFAKSTPDIVTDPSNMPAAPPAVLEAVSAGTVP